MTARPHPVTVVDRRMRALTIHQPFAWAIGHDRPDLPRKNFEIRTEPTRYRGPVLIHAGRKPPLIAYEINVAAVAVMGGPGLATAAPMYEAASYSGFIAIARVAECEFVTRVGKEPKTVPVRLKGHTQDLSCDGWRVLGRYAWRLEDIRPLPFVGYEPGFLGFWTVDVCRLGEHKATYQAAWDDLAGRAAA